MEPSPPHSGGLPSSWSFLKPATQRAFGALCADTKAAAMAMVPRGPAQIKAFNDMPAIMLPPPSLAEVRAQAEPVTAISRELALSPLQASALGEGVSPEDFVRFHQQILKRVGLAPAIEQGASTPAGESFNPVGVFGFYDLLTRQLPKQTPHLPDGGLALRQAVAREREALTTRPPGGPVDAIRSLLERLERALREADAAWAAQAPDATAVAVMIRHIAETTQPVADKARRVLALATARPQVLTTPGVFDCVHAAMLQALRQDPIWCESAPASGRASAPDPGAVFRFYARLRDVAATLTPMQATSRPWRMELSEALADVDTDKSLRHQAALRAQLGVSLRKVMPLREAQIQGGTTLAMRSVALVGSAEPPA